MKSFSLGCALYCCKYKYKHLKYGPLNWTSSFPPLCFSFPAVELCLQLPINEQHWSAEPSAQASELAYYRCVLHLTYYRHCAVLPLCINACKLEACAVVGQVHVSIRNRFQPDWTGAVLAVAVLAVGNSCEGPASALLTVISCTRRNREWVS